MDEQSFIIWQVGLGSIEDFIEMAGTLFETTTDVLLPEYQELLRREDAVIFVAYEDQRAVGFAQCELRSDYVEGTTTSPVGYLEGIYVKPEYQKQGIAKQLLVQCENWARQMGCQEFGSDCTLDNEASYQFHLAEGFQEVNRLITFTKKL